MAWITFVATALSDGYFVTSNVSTRSTSFSTGQIIRVVGDRDYPPFCYLDNGIPAGFDIDLIREVARVMHLQLEIELKPWSEARELLQNGQADVIPGMARIPAREVDFDFSTPIKQLNFGLFVPSDSTITTIDDARDASIMVQKGGVMYDLIKQQGVLRRMEPVADAPEAIGRLVAGECDGAIVNRVQGFYILKQKGHTGIKSLNQNFPTIPYCLAVTKGKQELIDLLNEGLSNVKAEGTYDAIYDKWFSVYNESSNGRFVKKILLGTGLITFLLILFAIINLSLRNQVRNRTAELRQIIDLIPFSIFARDRQGRYILANQATAQIMGIPITEIIGKKHNELHPDDPHIEQYVREDRQVLESRQSMFIPESRVVDRYGHRRFIQVSKIPFRQRDGVATSVLCVVLDITDLKQAEEAVRTSRENLMITLNSIADGVVATDSEGRIVSINPVAEKMTGCSARESIGMKLGSILNLINPEGENQPVDEIMRLAMQDGELTGLAHQLSLQSRDGTMRDVSLNWSPIRKEEGRYAGLVLVLRDVTEEIRLTHRLNETQRMESIGRLAGGVAHDFNNLLAGIMGYAELLNISLKENHEGRTYLKGIFEASERARDLIQQLLAFSRRSARDTKPVDLHMVISQFTSLLQHTLDRRISITQHLQASETAVLGDRTQLQNALLNLGVNARDAMPSGGTLAISTRNIVLAPAECEKHPYPIRAGTYINVTITDTGVGMDREMLHHIFEPFFTTKGMMGGTGLGLAAVYGTVKDHGGYIDVISKPGHGTSFTLGFPTTPESIVGDTHAGHNPSESGSGCILIVDDEEIVMKTVNEILRSLGYETKTAANGREAIDIFRLHHASIHLVLLDMIMPEISGEETFRALKKIDPGVKAIISSGYMQDHRMDALVELGVIDIMQKPFRKNELAAKVAGAMRAKPSTPAN